MPRCGEWQERAQSSQCCIVHEWRLLKHRDTVRYDRQCRQSVITPEVRLKKMGLVCNFNANFVEAPLFQVASIDEQDHGIHVAPSPSRQLAGR